MIHIIMQIAADAINANSLHTTGTYFSIGAANKQAFSK
jgi:hypothetical protein